MRATCRSVCTVFASLLAIGVGCIADSGSEVHLIPHGYLGPVVIIFDDPNGEDARRGDDGAIVFEIGNHGVLRTTAPAPVAGFYSSRFYYMGPDGQKSELPFRASSVDELQVFGDVVGVTGMLDGVPTGEIRWYAYIVGTPSTTSDWGQQRDSAVRRAVRDSVGAREHENEPR